MEADKPRVKMDQDVFFIGVIAGIVACLVLGAVIVLGNGEQVAQVLTDYLPPAASTIVYAELEDAQERLDSDLPEGVSAKRAGYVFEAQGGNECMLFSVTEFVTPLGEEAWQVTALTEETYPCGN